MGAQYPLFKDSCDQQHVQDVGSEISFKKFSTLPLSPKHGPPQVWLVIRSIRGTLLEHILTSEKALGKIR